MIRIEQRITMGQAKRMAWQVWWASAGPAAIVLGCLLIATPIATSSVDRGSAFFGFLFGVVLSFLALLISNGLGAWRRTLESWGPDPDRHSVIQLTPEALTLQALGASSVTPWSQVRFLRRDGDLCMLRIFGRPTTLPLIGFTDDAIAALAKALCLPPSTNGLERGEAASWIVVGFGVTAGPINGARSARLLPGRMGRLQPALDPPWAGS